MAISCVAGSVGFAESLAALVTSAIVACSQLQEEEAG